MAPLADLFNHKNPADLQWKFETDSNGERAIVYEALRDIEQGGEVFVSYGTATNAELLATYGFIVPDNPELAKIKVTLPRDQLRDRVDLSVPWSEKTDWSRARQTIKRQLIANGGDLEIH